MNLFFASAGAGMALMVLVPCPRRCDGFAAPACAVTLSVATAVMASSIVLVAAFNLWYTAVAVGLLGLTVLFVCFWLSKSGEIPTPDAAQSDDDSDGGGGGGPRRKPPTPVMPPPAPTGPDPAGADWDAFDSLRQSWEPDRDRELTPA